MLWGSQQSNRPKQKQNKKKKKKNQKLLESKPFNLQTKTLSTLKKCLNNLWFGSHRFKSDIYIYIYILFCVLTTIVEASTAMRCYQTMRLSLSLSLSLHFLHFYRSSLLYCHGEGFGYCKRWIGCAWPTKLMLRQA